MDIAPELKRIKRSFVPFGSVELHGCETGKGTEGSQLLQELAKLWDVPVSAGTEYQASGGLDTSTFRFEGKSVTKTPSGSSLEGWAQSVQQTRAFVLR